MPPAPGSEAPGGVEGGDLPPGGRGGRAPLPHLLPIYFLANESGALVGGITPSYSSHGEEHWGLDVFLGLKAPLAFGPR